MAEALGFVLNAAGLFVPLGMESQYTKEEAAISTSVQIIVGSGGSAADSLGGNVPHIALWDNNGNRIGQYHPKNKDKIKPGDDDPLTVLHTENGNQQADPYYVMLSNLENDAICISAVVVSNNKLSGSFYGDTGYKCGQSWFLSQNEIGSDFMKPRCVWLDADHTNGINARALSFHLNDMAPSEDKISEYQNITETLCQSTPRFAYWGNLLPDGVIPFFNPPLQYKVDSASTDSEGADVDPNAVIDKPGQYNRGVYMYQGEKTKRMAQTAKRNATASSNHDPSHLIITHDARDDVAEVCGHPNSYGWDIASTAHGIYCDMENKQLYPICEAGKTKASCFCLDTQAIIPPTSIGTRDVAAASIPVKAYTSVAYWGK